MRRLAPFIALTMAIAGASRAQPACHFDPEPWLKDLVQAKEAFSRKYANWDWAVFEREADINALFTDVATRIRKSHSEADARAAFQRVVSSLGDGHVVIDWPIPAQVIAPGKAPTITAAAFCSQQGYESRQAGVPVAAAISGYQPLPTQAAPEFPAGLLALASDKVGIVRIGEFVPQDSPEICEDAIQKLSLPISKSCDEACQKSIESYAYGRMSRDFASRLRSLRENGATVLVIDVTRNGGGTEWAEAAARIVSAKPILSESLGFLRDQHWVDEWGELATDLRNAVRTASASDAKRLEEWAAEADSAQAQARSPCSSEPFVEGKRPNCSWLGRAGYATGLVRDASPQEFQGKSWGSLVFTPAEYTYERGVWRGPVVVLVDGETWSAAEEFAAVLQDSGAAIIAGSPSGGAGCGHTGDSPTLLTHSGAVLRLPDCARFRLSGRNEVAGIDPDVLVGWHPKDGARRRGLRLIDRLADILHAAHALTPAPDPH